MPLRLHFDGGDYCENPEVSLWETTPPVGPQSLLPVLFLAGFLMETRRPQLTLRNDSPKTLGCEDTGHVKPNHPMRRLAPTVLFAWRLVVGTKWWPLPVTRDGSGRWGEMCRLVSAGLKRIAASLELHHSDGLSFLWNNAVWWANSIKMDRVKIFLPFSYSLGKISKYRRSWHDICIHNHSPEHWGFNMYLYVLPYVFTQS